jgi:two-component system, cell cycle response regulator DivK
VTTAAILIVEDNELNLELASDLLIAAGYSVLQAGTAEEGVRLAKTALPSLILMDLRLPGLDGYAALGQLKADPKTSGIPTIALTAQAMRGDREQALEAGFTAYIPKPIDTRTFCGTIARVLGDRVPPRTT